MLAFFISPHGMGHAARACAVMEALLKRRPHTHFHVFTRVPRAFFSASLPRKAFTYHPLQSDVGLIQRTPLEADLSATRHALAHLYPPSLRTLERLRPVLRHCCAILCDISPLGIAAAHHAGHPAVLIENFTWDWIYRHYNDGYSPLRVYADMLAPLFEQTDLHIQTEPVCQPHPQVDLTVPLVARRPRKHRAETRAALGVPAQALVLLISLGEPLAPQPVAQVLTRYPDLHLLIPGGEHLPPHPRLHTPPREACYHPDLMHASDYLLAKAGYSTLAEAGHAGLPFAYLARPRFPESAILERFIHQHLGGISIPLEAWR
ncbi:MAG: hypothetical protein D6755_08870, partial [Anaerolineae bacterium]